MKIDNEFTVSVPIAKAWEVLSDLEQVAPLMPGAQLTGRDGDDFLGKVKIKVGPVTSEFSGKAHFLERDEATHRAVVDGRGKEARGTGNAAAVVTLQLHEAGDHTRVTVETDLKIVGKLAQFGSSMLQQVSEKLLGQFVDSLEAKLAGGDEDAAPAAEVVATAATPGAEALGAPAAVAPRIAPAPEPEPIDLLQLAGGTAVTKYAAAGVAALVLLILIALLRRRRTE
ncbi:carbon monoxide dehydrogenase subunit G [Mycolicibacterium sp. BK556]|uniref:SRPBCC family protein n=1 Tax=Mycobacteriaceae TaxID=1762 RepID=UPI001061E08C|nr:MULTISPECIES: SRPBCC family protein [Mycobacteriaceae]MBB3604977.1 carbon monoxide dehydrogenase subunit G [Mycolicibacterium sp. BK556]MBB3635173.1 carbon monoxide dehydrogenase subunit G [Mycolicibacterium sp. BK607]MBB3748033.1 carbon monoxide dehydrogenase subunit G [Mycolicibacterium sp. BK634]TDO07833.1 carbon monoxide dehydrogenase subunit G [Mycobacterium sp. BK086]